MKVYRLHHTVADLLTAGMEVGKKIVRPLDRGILSFTVLEKTKTGRWKVEMNDFTAATAYLTVLTWPDSKHKTAGLKQLREQAVDDEFIRRATPKGAA